MLGWLKPLLELLVLVAQYFRGERKKREQEASDPVNKTKDIEDVIDGDNEAGMQDAVHNMHLRRRFRDSDDDQRV